MVKTLNVMIKELKFHSIPQLQPHEFNLNFLSHVS